MRNMHDMASGGPVDREHDPLTALLSEARPNADLPPGFGDGVWRRVRLTMRNRRAKGALLWRMVELLLQPRQLLAGAGLTLALGAILGVVAEQRQAETVARDRYLASVAPQVIR